MLYSECRHKKETELRISSVKKLKDLLLSLSAVSVGTLAKVDILNLMCIGP